MTISIIDQEFEKARLQRIYDLIKAEVSLRDIGAASTKAEIVSMRKSFWDTITNSNDEIENVIEIAQRIHQLDAEQAKYESKRNTINKLAKLKCSPYFGRVDFEEHGLEKENIYIGLHSFIDYEGGTIYIYDWRSPISSIFYEFEIGAAEYESPNGMIHGNISLKRQYKIHENIIDYMFDSSVKIDDEILQEILSKNVDDKMKNIVTTIQKEQNRIIRDSSNSIVIVQGAAGSGKTSIALHRVAYLLYKHRSRNMSSDNIVIFSPNQMFNDYISNVLPELGEENINQTTFIEYTQRFIGPGYRIEDANEQMEYLLSEYDDPKYTVRTSSIKFKSSPEFFELIKNYADYIKSDGIRFTDIIYNGKLVVSKAEIEEMFHRDFNMFPVVKRLGKIRDRIYKFLNPIKAEIVERMKKELEMDEECLDDPVIAARLNVMRESKPIMERIETMTSLNPYSMYIELFEDSSLCQKLSPNNILPENFDRIRRETINSLRDNFIHYDDVPGLLFLKGELEGVLNLSDIKHVVIDEAQDYTPLQYAIFNQLFPYSSMTILGDLNQAIHPYMNTKDYKKLQDIFMDKNPSIFELYRSYRSTREIAEFTQELLMGADKIEYINRPGEKPLLISFKEDEDPNDIILRDIVDIKKAGYKSTAVICKTENEASRVFKELNFLISKAGLDIKISLVNKDSLVFTTGIVVIPSYLSKGLEFDAVIIYDASQANYTRDEERKLFYTICTRALHKLHIYYRGNPSDFISTIDNSYYNKK